MPESATAAPAAAPAAPPAASDAVQSPPAPAKLKLKSQKFGDLELPEADVVSALERFAALGEDDFKAQRQLKEIESHFADEGKLAELLTKRGLDPTEWAEKILSKHVNAQVEAATLNPEQKRVKELEAQLAAVQADKKDQADKSAKAKFDADTEEASKALAQVVEAALKETSIPEDYRKEPAVLRRLGHLLLRNQQLGTEVPAQVLAKLVEQEIVKEHDFVFAKTGRKALYDRLGRQGVEELIKMYAAERTAKPPEAPAKKEEAASEPKHKDRRAEMYERSREEQKLLRGTATNRPSRYYGKR